MPSLTPHKDKPQDDSHPFGMPWLDSCYQETLLPNGPWQKISEKLCEDLADKVRKQLEFPSRMQMIFQLLGFDFVQKYFPNHEYDPLALEPPNMTPEERKKLQIDAQNWLKGVLEKSAADLGCMRPSSTEPDSQPMSEDMKEFLRSTQYTFSRGMDRHLYLQEREVEKQWQEVLLRQQQVQDAQIEANHADRLRRERERLHGSRGPKGILKNAYPAPSAMSTTSSGTNWSEKTETTANVKGALKGASEDPPVFWGMQSNSLGRSLIAILRRDPRRFHQVAAALHGKQLPGQLRAYIWLDVLLKQERGKLKDLNVEKIVRERFGKSVARGVGELRIVRATHCPITGLIDTAVVELYDATPAMRMHMKDNVHMREAAKTLNVLYVFDRTYEPYLVHWLFPLQLAFQDSAGEREHVYELAMYLDLLNKTCFPKWPQIFATAEKVMTRLATADEDLETHLKIIAQKDPKINPKEFLVHVIHQEKAKAEALLRAKPGSPGSEKMSQELLADPLIFLRKWIGEGFVGVLDTQAAIYVWDQCFMQIWSPKVIEDVCLALLLLLRHKFMKATDYTSMKNVFLNEPCRLYTADIQKAWLHIQKDGDLNEVPEFNRQRPKEEPEAEEARSETSPTPSSQSLAPLRPVGIKDLALKLCIPPESIQREKWLSDLKIGNLKLLCTVYFGSIKLRSLSSTTAAISKSVETDKYGGKIYTVEFPAEKFEFKDLDPSEYDVEKEMGGNPFVIIRVDYSHQDKGASAITAPVTLGWSRIKAYQHKSETGKSTPSGGDGSQQWVLHTGDYFYTVYAGPVSDNIVGAVPRTPSEHEYSLIGTNSQLKALVYDPLNERPVPATRRPASQPPAPLQSAPTPARTPTPTPTPPPPSPGDPGVNDTFDLYVDGVDNIPDNATIVKVTGRFLSAGQLKGIPDILAFPDLTSSARCPRFKFRMVVNGKKITMATSMLLLLRVYTVEKKSGTLVVVGSCLFDVFNQETEKVVVGGHSKVLHCGMPDTPKGKTKLTGASMDDKPRIPAAMVHFRLAKHTEDHALPPKVGKGYHKLVDQLNDSEKRVADSFEKDTTFPATVTDMILALQDAENDNNTGKDHMLWLEDRLDNKKNLPPNTPAGDIDLSGLVLFRIDKGMKVQISRAYGFPFDRFIQCFARVIPGDGALSAPPHPQWSGKDEKLISLKHDYDSLQKAPRWIDEETVLHPLANEYTCLLIQVFGLDVEYSPHPDHSQPGEVTLRDGQPVSLEGEALIGWAVMPLFAWEYTYEGEHHIPVFKNPPDNDILDLLAVGSVADALKSKKWTKSTKYDGAGLVIKVRDSHYIEEAHTLLPLKKVDILLDAVGSSKANYSKAEKETQGKKMSQFVIQSLETKYRKQGTNSEIYKKELDYFVKVMSGTFYNLMEDELMKAGYGPL